MLVLYSLHVYSVLNLILRMEKNIEKKMRAFLVKVVNRSIYIYVMRICKKLMLISYARLDHMLYSINYNTFHLFFIHLSFTICIATLTWTREQPEWRNTRVWNQLMWIRYLKYWFWNGELELNNKGRIISR